MVCLVLEFWEFWNWEMLCLVFNFGIFWNVCIFLNFWKSCNFWNWEMVCLFFGVFGFVGTETVT